MSSPPKPMSDLQFALWGVGFLGCAAWTFHDGMKVLRTGQPMPLHNFGGDAFEYFGMSALFLVLGLVILAIVTGLIKKPKDPR